MTCSEPRPSTVRVDSGTLAVLPDNKLTKSIGEHWVCSVLAGYGWSVALTRDGIERTDILATHTTTSRAIEVQVKTASHMPKPNWLVGRKGLEPARSDREWFVMIALGPTPCSAHMAFVVPRNHVAAGAYIGHMNWLTDPTAPPGKRHAPVEQARILLETIRGYENRWDLLLDSADRAPVLLPSAFRTYAKDPRVGLPDGHPWKTRLPRFQQVPGDISKAATPSAARPS